MVFKPVNTLFSANINDENIVIVVIKMKCRSEKACRKLRNNIASLRVCTTIVFTTFKYITIIITLF